MQRISWIGVGIMGKAMVRNLMKAGYEVHIYARHPEKVADVVSEGAVPHGSIAECVKASEVVITMVGFPKDVEEVYFAPGFFMKHFVKDMRLAEEEAENAGLDLNVLQQALSNCQSLIDRGCGDLGTQALIKFYEK